MCLNVSSFGDYWKDIVTLSTSSDLAPIPPYLLFFFICFVMPALITER